MIFMANPLFKGKKKSRLIVSKQRARCFVWLKSYCSGGRAIFQNQDMILQIRAP
jgi:hypothetical protein